MSLLSESGQSSLERFACRVLKAGLIPRHVAFIMDGNRRYAKKMELAGPIEGHTLGFDRLAKTLEWCRHLGIAEVTVYAFSIENFKRKQEEVDGIFDLARAKFSELMAEKEKMRAHGIRIRFLGDLRRLPPDLQRLCAEIQLFSQDFVEATLNVCISYTSQDEMQRSASALALGVSEGRLRAEEISEGLVSGCLDTAGSEVELLVRTSGELRLSDFLLWQSSAAVLYFTPVLWPEFGFWDLAKAVLHFQRNAGKLRELRSVVGVGAPSDSESAFLRQSQARRQESLRAVL